MGGFMSYTLACELGDKIAAIASVAGHMPNVLINSSSCQTAKAMPVLEIHGTKDFIVPWNGHPTCDGGYPTIPEVINFWKNKAGCSEAYTEFTFEDIDTNDGSTAKMYTYKDCSSENTIKLIEVENGGHSWPGSEVMRNLVAGNSAYSYFLSINFDFDASQVIWDFFKEHSLQDKSIF